MCASVSGVREVRLRCRTVVKGPRRLFERVLGG
nr:MAG TPA: hypothetical protein [Caudoviricetes sp.]